ncbi:MAG: hypothetical protein ACI4EF_12060 [Coprococcus sp.]
MLETNDKNNIEEPLQDNFSSENKLELHSMSRKERHVAKRKMYLEYTKNMTFKDKVVYFLDYYKWYIIIPICCITFILYIGITIYKNTRPVALSYAILNVENEEAVDLSFQEDYAACFNIPDSYRFNASTTLNIDYDYFNLHSEYITTTNNTDYSVLATSCEYGDYDIIISNESGIKYCGMQQIAQPLMGYLPSDIYDEFKDIMYYTDDQYGNSRPFAIDISNTSFARNLNLGYTDVYLAFPGKTDSNFENAKHFLNYVFGTNY